MPSARQSVIPTAPPAFSLPIRVYYEDTDAAGVVYYANYLCYCERARTEWLRSIGFEQQKLRTEQGLAFVVRAMNADYVSPAALDDALVVETRIGQVGGASIVFGQKILRADTLLFDARFTIACVNLDRKRPAPLPADLRAQLEKLNAA